MWQMAKGDLLFRYQPIQDSLPEVAPLRENEVHLWSVRLDDKENRHRFGSWLTPAEVLRANQFGMAEVRDQFRIVRGVLRYLLGQYLSLDPVRVPIIYHESGKPLLGHAFQDWHFNVSHKDSRGLFAFARHRRVGIDIERFRVVPNLQNLIDRFFAESEKERFRRVPQEEKPACFFRAWTRKEAILKAVGSNVHAFDLCAVTFEANCEAEVLTLLDDEQARERWVLHSWSMEENFLAAVAVEKGISGARHGL